MQKITSFRKSFECILFRNRERKMKILANFMEEPE
jgi:hypothetical protein